ncbi:MAG: hypothetical protein EXX96DRAFT_590750 [Benjaminiella poitrasii]|nr:MAG: hypothetical protein EXX96DRAFT_590750 [Benjaminiella poitrasii]
MRVKEKKIINFRATFFLLSSIVIMTIFGGLPFFGLVVSSQKKPDRIRKSIAPTISNVLKRQQPFSTSAAQKTIAANKSSSSTSSSYHYQQHREKASSSKTGPEVITESSILDHFPRPNLMPTLHSLLFGNINSHNAQSSSTSTSQGICNNCSGPHSTDFCPC